MPPETLHKKWKCHPITVKITKFLCVQIELAYFPFMANWKARCSINSPLTQVFNIILINTIPTYHWHQLWARYLEGDNISTKIESSQVEIEIGEASSTFWKIEIEIGEASSTFWKIEIEIGEASSTFWKIEIEIREALVKTQVGSRGIGILVERSRDKSG